MGAWGTGLYSDDTTCEVRDAFKAHLEGGMSHSEAESAILMHYAEVISDHQIACLVYFGLADTEWKFGCLSDRVRRKTLALLEDGGDIKYWKEDSPSDVKARDKTLLNLGARLVSEQPILKHVKVKVQKAPRKQISSPIGSVFMLSLPCDEIAALKFVGLRPVGNMEVALFRLLPWRGRQLPPASAFEAIPDQIIPLSGKNEFSILIDGRKKLTTYLIETDIILGNTTPLDDSYWSALGIEILPQLVQDAIEHV